MITKEQVIAILETVMDPDVGVDIWTMGLIYDITIIDEKNLKILMTLTSPACPLGPIIEEDMKTKLSELGFTNIDIELTFTPPWQPPAILKEALGLM